MRLSYSLNNVEYINHSKVKKKKYKVKKKKKKKK